VVLTANGLLVVLGVQAFAFVVLCVHGVLVGQASPPVRQRLWPSMHATARERWTGEDACPTGSYASRGMRR
jgi:hypothetical protein